jgi:DNA-binding NtrC family response regulator
MSRVPRTLAEHLALHERLIIIQTLALCGNSRKKAAEVLGVRRHYLWSRMRKLDIKVPRTTSGRPRKQPT